MPTQRSRSTRTKAPVAARKQQPRTGAAGISNRPPQEEIDQQQQLPPRGQAKKKTPGGKG